MADNTTKYKAVIEAEVKGKDEMEELGDQAEETGDKFVKLQLQIRQTQKAIQEAAAAGDKAKFEKLKAELDDLEDGLEAVQLKSKQFDDQLASLPGPAGAAGNAIKGVDGAFKLLAANPIVAVIGAAVGIFLALKRSLESTAEGQATLNRVSQAFSSVLGPILATLEKVAVPLFNGLAFVIEKVGKAFAFFAEKLGISKEKIAEATLSVDEVQQKTNENEKKRIEEQTKANEEALKKRQDARDKAAAERKKKEEQAEAERKKKEEEAEAERKKKEEERVRNLAEANKVLTEAFVATLEQRDQDLFKAGQAQNERLLALQKAGITDVSSVIEQGRIEVAAINKKYDDEAAKKLEEEAKKKKEIEDKKTQDEKDAAEQRKQIKLEEINFRNMMQNLELDIAEKFGGILQELAGKNKKLATAGVVIQAAASIARIIANTAAANARAILELGPIAGSAFAIKNSISAGLSVVATTIAAAKAIQQINSSDSGAAASGGAGAPKVPAPTPPTVTSAPTPQINTGGGQNPTQQIAETIGAASGKPVQAYVVSQQVSSKQAFDRRVNSAATF
jgi:chromosome segregation ATPase